MLKGQRGFTLIELLITVVIVGVLAAIAIPQAGTVKERAFIGTMKYDLRNLATAEEAYFTEHQTYAASTAALSDLFRPSRNVTVTIGDADNEAWEATATHSNTDTECSIQFSGADPGIATCS